MFLPLPLFRIFGGSVVAPGVILPFLIRFLRRALIVHVDMRVKSLLKLPCPVPHTLFLRCQGSPRGGREVNDARRSTFPSKNISFLIDVADVVGCPHLL